MSLASRPARRETARCLTDRHSETSSRFPRVHYGERALLEAQDAVGAVLFMSSPARRSVRGTYQGWSAETKKGKRGLVVRGRDMSDQAPAMEAVLDRAHLLLDLLSIRGLLAASLADPQHLSALSWRDRDAVILRLMSTGRLSVGGSAEVQVGTWLAADQPRDLAPEWHPSYRYFRHSQVTTDLLDGFRNLYLALESLLSGLCPKRLGERETDWLPRALKETTASTDMADHLPGDRTTSVETFASELWRNFRTAAFHATEGRAVILPYANVDRARLGAWVSIRH